jgi:hypothetical protein
MMKVSVALRPLLLSSGQSSWLQIQRSKIDSRRYKFFWDVVGLQWGPLSLVSTIEELLERKCSDFGLEIRYGRRDPSRWPHNTLYPHMLALTSPTSGGLSVGIVHSRTQATEFSSFKSVSRQRIRGRTSEELNSYFIWFLKTGSEVTLSLCYDSRKSSRFPDFHQGLFYHNAGSSKSQLTSTKV